MVPKPLRAGSGRLLMALVAALFFTHLVTHQAVATRPESPDTILREVMRELGLDDARLVTLPSPLSEPGIAPQRLTVPVVVDGKEHRLVLQRHSLRSAGFLLYTQGADGTLEEAFPPAPRTYRGTIEGRRGPRVAASLTGSGGIRVLVALDPERSLVLQPAADVLPGADPRLHVVFRSADAYLPEDNLCGVLEPPDDDRLHVHVPDEIRPLAGGGPSVCEIAFDADYEFFERNGYDVGTSLADIESVLNNVSLIYERDAGITYSISGAIVRTSEPDPYGSEDPYQLLYDFQDQWNAHHGSIPRDTAHLVTGKALSGGILGVAYIGVVCNTPYAYGFSKSIPGANMLFRTAITAHEIGHNWNATHCSGGDCRIMCPQIGGCSGDVTSFGGLAVSEITTFRDGRSCLGEVETALDLPFVDTFSSGVVDAAKWSDIDGVEISSAASNDPTEPYSLDLDAAGNSPADDDRIVSRPLRLGGRDRVTVSYFTEARGVEAGETLFVEYLDDGGGWSLLETIVSAGVAEDHFLFRHHTLPGSASAPT
jgi:hypothetical protein